MTSHRKGNILDYIILGLVFAMAGLCAYAIHSKHSADIQDNDSFHDDMLGAMKNIETQIKGLRESQDSLDGKSAKLISDMDARVSKLETKTNDDIKLTLTHPLQVSLVYRKREALPKATGPLLKRAKEMSQ
jgi:hypothetical protein